VARWWGGRTIQRVVETGDAAMVRDAQARYALGRVLQDDLAADSPSMRLAMQAARDALYPPTPTPDPTPTPVVPPAPPAPRPTRQAPAKPARTSAAGVARSDPAGAAQLRATAMDWARDRLRNGHAVTGRQIADEFGKGEEWGRQRLGEARDRMHGSPNGHHPA
jgi:hypothetical protein